MKKEKKGGRAWIQKQIKETSCLLLSQTIDFPNIQLSFCFRKYGFVSLTAYYLIWNVFVIVALNKWINIFTYKYSKYI